MVKKIINTLNREFGNINEAALLLGFFAVLSQVLALVRDRIFAHMFGAGLEMDIYYMAFRIPDLVFIAVASLTAVTVLIPFLLSHLKDSRQAAMEFLHSIFSAFFWTVIVISVLIFFLLPLAVPVIAPGFSAAAQDQLVLLSRIMLLSPIFLGISNVFASVTQSLGRFFVYALSPVFYNIGIIAGAWLLYPIFGLIGLAFGVVLGALLHFAIQIPVLLRNRMLPRLKWRINLTQVKKVALISLPRSITLSLSTILLITILAMASSLGEGAVAIFNFSFNLQSVPLSIVGVSYAVAAFPALTRSFSTGDLDTYFKKVLQTASQIVFWSLPLVFLFIVLRAQIVRTILGTGMFSWEDTRLAAAALALFALSITAQALLLLFIKSYYAASKTLKPLLVALTYSIFSVILAHGLLSFFQSSIVFQYFIEDLLRVTGIEQTAVLMLPLAFSAGSILGFFLLWWLFRRDFIGQAEKARLYLQRFYRTTFESFAASFFMAMVSYYMLGTIARFFNLETFLGVFLQGLLSGLAGIFVGLIFLLAMNNREIKTLFRVLQKKIWRTKVYLSSEHEL